MAALRRHLSIANVLSTAALVFSLGLGGATASALLDGKDVRNNSLTAKDFKKRSIGARDVRSAPLPYVYERSSATGIGDCFSDCEGDHPVSSQPPSRCDRGDVAIGGGFGGLVGDAGTRLELIEPLGGARGVVHITQSPAAIVFPRAAGICATPKPQR